LIVTLLGRNPRYVSRQDEVEENMRRRALLLQNPSSQGTLESGQNHLTSDCEAPMTALRSNLNIYRRGLSRVVSVVSTPLSYH